MILQDVASRLSTVSVRRYVDPHTRFAWPERVDPDRFATSAALSPLFGHPLYAELTDEQRWRLHLCEAAQFFSLNIAGERELMTGLARRLFVGPLAPVSEYLQHFLHEENAHTFVFARFCQRYARIYPDRAVAVGRPELPGEDDVLFFGRVVVFEEVATWFNLRIARDPGVWGLARQINAYHADDEARHLAFGRRALVELWARFAPSWSADGRDRVRASLRQYLQATLNRYVDPAVFRDAGLPGSALALRDEVLSSPARVALHGAASRRAHTALVALEGDP